MKRIQDLLRNKERIQVPEIPEILSQENLDKVHIVFFSPKVNASGYYRMLLPYLELAKSQRFATHIIGLHKEDFNSPFEFTKVPLLEEWVLWADYLVFPILTTDCIYFFKACRAINTELQIVMDVDMVLHALTQEDPLSRKTSKEMLWAFEKNMNQVDIVSSPNAYILDFYDNFIEKHYGNTTTFFALLPSLVSRIEYQQIEQKKARDSNSIRIGILVTNREAEDVKSILYPLKKLQQKSPKNVVFVIYGWNGKLPDGSTPLVGLTVEYHRSVDFINYFAKLSSLQLDLALLPVRNRANHRFASQTNYLELSALGIPVIASKHSIYKECIVDGRTGNLAQGKRQWIYAIEKHIQDKAYSKKLGNAAKKQVWDFYSYTNENIAIFSELFR